MPCLCKRRPELTGLLQRINLSLDLGVIGTLRPWNSLARFGACSLGSLLCCRGSLQFNLLSIHDQAV